MYFCLLSASLHFCIHSGLKTLLGTLYMKVILSLNKYIPNNFLYNSTFRTCFVFYVKLTNFWPSSIQHVAEKFQKAEQGCGLAMSMLFNLLRTTTDLYEGCSFL